MNRVSEQAGQDAGLLWLEELLDAACAIPEQYFIGDLRLSIPALMFAYLQQEGVQVEAVACGCTFWNLQTVKWVLEHGDWPATDADMIDCTCRGGWQTNQGYQGKGYNGDEAHICLIVGPYLIDSYLPCMPMPDAVESLPAMAVRLDDRFSVWHPRFLTAGIFGVGLLAWERFEHSVYWKEDRNWSIWAEPCEVSESLSSAMLSVGPPPASLLVRGGVAHGET